MAKRLIVPADLQNWLNIYNFIVEYFLECKVSKKDVLGVLISSEEIFSNVIRHSKVTDESDIEVYIDYISQTGLMVIGFRYGGVEFNPLEVSTPDTRVSFKERREGGLGLLIVKKFTDNITYKYSCGKNVLEISKKAINF